MFHLCLLFTVGPVLYLVTTGPSSEGVLGKVNEGCQDGGTSVSMVIGRKSVVKSKHSKT